MLLVDLFYFHCAWLFGKPLQFISFTVLPMEASAKLLYVRREPSLRIMIYIFSFSPKSYRDWERLEVEPQSKPEKPSNIYLGRQSYTQYIQYPIFIFKSEFMFNVKKLESEPWHLSYDKVLKPQVTRVIPCETVWMRNSEWGMWLRSSTCPSWPTIEQSPVLNNCQWFR